MPEYISILRQSSVASIYLLLILVVAYSLVKGRIKKRELAVLYYVWLPIAVVTQIIMTYVRTNLSQSNIPVMNIYLIIEFVFLLYVLVSIKVARDNSKINYKLWGTIIFIGVILHSFENLEDIHNSAMLYTAIIYFHLTVSFIDLNKIDELLKDPISIIHIAIFTKAFGYSYFLIYQIDYKFPLAIYSGVNLIVQIIFGIAFILLMKRNA